MFRAGVCIGLDFFFDWQIARHRYCCRLTELGAYAVAPTALDFGGFGEIVGSQTIRAIAPSSLHVNPCVPRRACRSLVLKDRAENLGG